MAYELVQWATTDSIKFPGLAKEDNFLYFLTDTREIYKGAVPFTEAVTFYDNAAAKPAKGALGRIYIDSETLEGSVWNGTAWKQVIAPIAQSVDAANTTAPVCGKAVSDYVDGRITNVAGDFVTAVGYNEATKAVTFTKGGNTTEVPVTKLLASAEYNGETGDYTFKDAAGTVISTFNVPKDNFVKAGHYDQETEALVLEMQDGTSVSIPAADLVALYEAGETDTVKITITNGTEGNTITADVKLSAEAGNQIVKKADGLYVAVPDVSGKADKVAAAAVDQVLVADAEGNLAASGKKIGGAALNAAPDANTLATEAAVSAIKAAIEGTAADTYVAKANISTAIPGSGAADTKVASEKAVKDYVDTEVAKQVAKTSIVANQAAINTDTPDATKVMSEAAFVEAMSWKVL